MHGVENPAVGFSRVVGEYAIRCYQAILPVEDDVDIGPLDLANLNSSSIHGDLPSQMEEPALPGLAQVNTIQIIY